MKVIRDLFNHFNKEPSARELALLDLEVAKRKFLSEQSAAKYHAKMTEYYSETITRLTAYIGKE